jgi:hypothetical protein
LLSRQQLGAAAIFDDAPPVEHDEAIEVGQRRQPVVAAGLGLRSRTDLTTVSVIASGAMRFWSGRMPYLTEFARTQRMLHMGPGREGSFGVRVK